MSILNRLLVACPSMDLSIFQMNGIQHGELETGSKSFDVLLFAYFDGSAYMGDALVRPLGREVFRYAPLDCLLAHYTLRKLPTSLKAFEHQGLVGLQLRIYPNKKTVRAIRIYPYADSWVWDTLKKLSQEVVERREAFYSSTCEEIVSLEKLNLIPRREEANGKRS